MREVEEVREIKNDAINKRYGLYVDSKLSRSNYF